jgi:hypothetical protein
VVVEKLKVWLLAFLQYGSRPNYCHVTSQSVPETTCLRFAEQFQASLRGSAIQYVDYEAPRNRLPVVIPFEYETSWPATIRGRVLTIQPPRPKAFEGLMSSNSWFVDLQKDFRTGRAVEELQLPPSQVVFELLNGPCPPNFEQAVIPRAGDGIDSINIRCSDRKEVVRQYLPTGEEILLEILREHGIEPLVDEKRNAYQPVLKRFGGFQLAAAAFAGSSARVLLALFDDDNPMMVNQIKSVCKLGAGPLSGSTYLERVEQMFINESVRMKRIARSRFEQYSRHRTPATLKLTSLLDHWVDRSIATRHWKLGRCPACNAEDFESRLDIQRHVRCPRCGTRMALPAQVSLGYSLHPSVRSAIKEGIVPVVLTGRFLHRLTTRGFVWIPGVKCKLGARQGDIDIVACCDGHLVFCECKRLEAIPSDARVWDDITSQFLELVEIARICNGNLAVLASQVSSYPDSLKQRLKNEIGNTIPYLLLDQQDLEAGHRQVGEGENRRWLTFSHLIPAQFSEQRTQRSGGPRTIETGWGSYTS